MVWLQRLEFVKRLYNHRHGIYALPNAPIDGKVHVLGIDRGSKVHDYSKIRPQH